MMSKERNNEYELAVFVKNEDGTFDRFEEQHYQLWLYYRCRLQVQLIRLDLL
ncbi:MAG: hypothetical protein ACLR7D_01600 [Lachnospira eligens]